MLVVVKAPRVDEAAEDKQSNTLIHWNIDIRCDKNKAALVDLERRAVGVLVDDVKRHEVMEALINRFAR